MPDIVYFNEESKETILLASLLANIFYIFLNDDDKSRQYSDNELLISCQIDVSEENKVELFNEHIDTLVKLGLIELSNVS